MSELTEKEEIEKRKDENYIEMYSKCIEMSENGLDISKISLARAKCSFFIAVIALSIAGASALAVILCK